MVMRMDKISRTAVAALEDVKGRDIAVFDVKKMTAMFDKVIVATGDSNRQCRALASRVQEMVKEAGGRVHGVEGESAGEWVLVDLGGTVVHIMQPAIRQYYNLEELWTPPKKAARTKPMAMENTAKAAKPRAKPKTAA
jgi:ribosome-associated protein